MTQNLYKTHTAICKFGTLININKGELNRGQLKRSDFFNSLLYILGPLY